ncbi:hypothetical protein [Autumnicola psychrophila]|uniref:DUF4494 domain-containing protein n=1 Tax=Autumnicola psychrophila TaxID=3075592 RepID=A0ABU3DP35_9FLAO|nr:hypothetical protein [Zunongwangia sp. F225]MDT0685471.1 hypothetical protein [Zunongwangia sp. F225]
MTLKIVYKSVNVDFPDDKADEPQQDKQQYLWTKSFNVEDVEKVDILEDEPFLLKAELEDGTQLQKQIIDIFILRVTTPKSQKDYAVSKEVLCDISEIPGEKGALKEFCFYLNEVTEIVEIIEGVFLTEEEAYGDGFEVV